MEGCSGVLRSWWYFFKQKTAYEMRISGWSADVCSSDLRLARIQRRVDRHHEGFTRRHHEAIRAGHAFRIEQAVDRDRVRALRRPFEVIRDEDRKLLGPIHAAVDRQAPCR